MRIEKMEISLSHVISAFIGTIPLAIVIVGWLIRTEHRLTRIETVLEIAHEEK